MVDDVEHDLSSGEWREGGSELRSVWGIHIPHIFPVDSLFNGEPFGATNRVSQPSNSIPFGKHTENYGTWP